MKRCPFCGGNMEGQPSGFSASTREVVANFICVHCDTAITIFRKTYAEALEVWNKRLVEDELLEVLEALIEEVDDYEMDDVLAEKLSIAREVIAKARGK